MADEKRTLLEELRDKRTRLQDEAGAAIEARETDRRTFIERSDATDEDRSAFTVAEETFGEAHKARMADLKELDQRIDEQELQERRRADAAKASRHDVQVTSEPLTYRKDLDGKVSYWRDLAVTQVAALGGNTDPAAARSRLNAHAAEMSVEMPKRQQERERLAQRQVDRAERDFTGSFPNAEARGLEASPFERRTNPNRTDGQGGFGIPPLWLIDDFILGLRAGRVASGLARSMSLPEGTDSINIPKLATGTLVAPQSDLGPVASQDYTDTAVTAGVKTLAGQQDVALQLIEQSPGDIIDTVVMGDLMGDYNRLVDRHVVYGAGGPAVIQGIYPATNWGAGQVATATAAANSGPAFFQTLAALAAKIARNRFSTENVHYLLNGRRYYWFGSTLDSSGRPIVSGEGFGPTNAAALQHGGAAAEGLVGGVPFGPHDIYVSENVPTTDNGSGVLSGTYDVAIAAKWDDLWLFEGALRSRVLSEVLSGTLELRFQLYNYVAFLVRYGQSIALAQGAGLAAPTGSIDTAMTF